jgi:hypothetical protein
MDRENIYQHIYLSPTTFPNKKLFYPFITTSKEKEKDYTKTFTPTNREDAKTSMYQNDNYSYHFDEETANSKARFDVNMNFKM